VVAGGENPAPFPDPPLNIDFWPVSRARYSIFQTVMEATKMYTEMGITEQDIDEVKFMLVRQPLHILALIQIIGFVQVGLSMMAFKNDIAFFKGTTDYAGLSSRSLVTDAAHAVVIFFYLYDYEYSSRIVLFEVGAGAAIAMWKVHQRMRLHVQWAFLLPWVASQTRDEMSSGEQTTEDIDVKLMRYMKWIFYPLSAYWGLHCLTTYEYKSWWSWLISSLADFAYTFGFINMMPQIVINYKLKSVSHLPWRVFWYKVNRKFELFHAWAFVCCPFSDVIN
jgi:hypothetical protein